MLPPLANCSLLHHTVDGQQGQEGGHCHSHYGSKSPISVITNSIDSIVEHIFKLRRQPFGTPICLHMQYSESLQVIGSLEGLQEDSRADTDDDAVTLT